MHKPLGYRLQVACLSCPRVRLLTISLPIILEPSTEQDHELYTNVKYVCNLCNSSEIQFSVDIISS